MNKWIELIVGIILIIVPIVCAVNFVNWGKAALHFLMGGVIVVAVIVGIIFLILGITELKE